MAAINFPASPNVNDKHTHNGKSWIWNGVYWSINDTSNLQSSWHTLGSTNYSSSTSPQYDYKYYRITNDITYDHNRVYEVIIDADDNSGHVAIYHLYISQHSNTGNHDRIIMSHVSGKPTMMRVALDSNEHVWIAATQKWGAIRIRGLHENEDVTSMPFADSQLASIPSPQFNQTTPFIWDGDTNTLALMPVSNLNGDFGIGTATPQSELDVNGIIRAGNNTSTGGGTALRVKYSSVGDHTANFGAQYSSGAPMLGYCVESSQSAVDGFVSSADNSGFGRGALVVSHELDYWSAGGQTTTVGNPVTMYNRFHIDSSGNVGIGTTSPSSLLELRTDSTNTATLSGTSGLDDMVIRGSENVGLMIVSKATSLTTSSSAATINFACDLSAGGLIAGSTDTQHGFIKTVIDTASENASMHLGLKGSEYLSILDGGHVDIGNFRIEQDGNGSHLEGVSSIAFRNTTDTWASAANHGIMSTDQTGTFTDDISINTYHDLSIRLDSNNNHSDGYLRIYKDTTTSSSSTLSHYFGHNTSGLNVSYMSGNVGINTSPRTDSYRLNMGGYIHMNNNNIDYVNQLHFNDNVRFYDEGNDNYLRFKWGNSGEGGIKFVDGDDNVNGAVYGSNSGFGLVSQSWDWAVRIYPNGETQLYYDGSEKLNTTSTGVNVTGSVNSTAMLTADSDIRWYVSSSDRAYQKADARDEGTDSRLHWHGSTGSSSTSFKHAWYDGSAYVNIDVTSGAVNFTHASSGTANLKVEGNTVYHGGNLTKASTSTFGLVKLGTGAIQTTNPNTPTTTASRTYAVQMLSNDQLVVNVPWTDSGGSSSTPSVSTIYFNGETTTSGAPGTDGAVFRYDTNFFGTSLDTLVIEKTDVNGNNPDGGIAFTNRGSDGIVETSMAIKGNGDIGIGTKTPETKLHVEGSLLVNSYAGATQGGGIFFRSHPNSDYTTNYPYNMSILAYDHSSNGNSADGLSINAYDGISFCTGSNTRSEKMRIESSGNVGIGTDDPTTDLHFYGKSVFIDGGGKNPSDTALSSYYGTGNLSHPGIIIGNEWAHDQNQKNSAWSKQKFRVISYNGEYLYNSVNSGVYEFDHTSQSWSSSKSYDNPNYASHYTQLRRDTHESQGHVIYTIGTSKDSSSYTGSSTSSGDIFKVHNNGFVRAYGSIMVGSSVSNLGDQAGTIRYNSTTDDFEGRKASKWTSMTQGHVEVIDVTPSDMNTGTDKNILAISGTYQINATHDTTTSSGTFTPSYTTSGTGFSNMTFNPARYGTYSRTGRTIYFNLYIYSWQYTAGSETGYLKISGLPFTSHGTHSIGRGQITIGYHRGWINAPTVGYVMEGTNQIRLFKRN